MAIIRINDMRKMDKTERERKLRELQTELAKERANIHIGAPAASPGKIKEIRKTIARFRTISAETNK